MEELCKEILNYFITIIEYNKVVEAKTALVRKQNFIAAIELREKEKQLKSQLPSLEDLQKLRKKLNKEDSNSLPITK